MSKRISIRLLGRILASVVVLLALVGLTMLTIRNGNAYAGEPGRTHRGFSGTGGPTPTPTVFGCPASTMRWSIVPGAALSSNDNVSNGLTAISSTDIWAVGSGTDPNTFDSEAVLEHWNGSAWSGVAVPSDPKGGVSLQGAYAINTSDVWAVGSNTDSPETEHWNGSSWAIFPQPASVIGTFATLNSVAGVASNDVWAVGVVPTGTEKPVIEHWNGSAWSVVAPADSSLAGGLTGVIALASNNVWAVGYTFNSTTNQTLVLHWDGSSWTQVASPDTSSTDSNILFGISASSPTDIWAVGTVETTSNEEALTMHWNGTAWTIVPTLQLPGFGGGFHGVSAVAANNVWAVGYDYSTFTPLVAHWNGSAWLVGSGQGSGDLLGVVALSNGTAWAVGQSAGTLPLIERYPTLMRTTHCSNP
ncbi:MAG: hypothetical protein OJF49_004440 [Ktedonobacterales bacterium]|jgi:hypothetical protein|nr:MAG: hypothetical protein OJF49_004440 [Ktedonobacterales bacterium]